MRGCKHEGCQGVHRAKGFCGIHYKMPSQLNPKPIQRTAIKVKTVEEPIQRATLIKKSRKKIAKKSASQIKKDKKYFPIRNKFMGEHPECEARISPECTFFSTEVHHPEGKVTEELYLDVTKFIAVCRNCHNYIGDHTAEAVAKGLSRERIY